MEVERLADFGSDPVVIDASGVATYRKLIDLISECEAALKSHGLRAGDSVVARIESSVEFLAAFLACQRAAIVFSPLTPTSSRQRIEHVAELIGAKLFLSLENRKFKADKIDRKGAIRDYHSYQKLFEAGGFIRFTSGTTAAPKGVFVAPCTAAQRVQAASAGLMLTPSARILWPFEMALHFVTLLPVVLNSGGCLLLPRSESPHSLSQILRMASADYIYAGPASYQNLSQLPPQRSPLKAAFSTSAPLAGSVRRVFEDSWQTQLRQIYAIFELGLVAIQPSESGVGARILPGIEVQVRDRSGSKLGVNEQGCIFIRTAGALDAYLNPLRLSSEIAPDGWFNSGDLGSLSENGDLHLYGRTAATIALGDETVSPEVIEGVLCDYDDIVAARVSKQSATELVAEVVLKADVKIDRDGIRKHCLAHLNARQVPYLIEQVDQLPFNESGKLIRAAVCN